ncbi:hypothetical protein [Fusobacterium sp. PH5-44]
MKIDYKLNEILYKVNKPFLYVDYNEMMDYNTILLSREDFKKDAFGNEIKLYEGLEVVGYQEDEHMDGSRDEKVS